MNKFNEFQNENVGNRIGFSDLLYLSRGREGQMPVVREGHVVSSCSFRADQPSGTRVAAVPLRASRTIRKFRRFSDETLAPRTRWSRKSVGTTTDLVCGRRFFPGRISTARFRVKVKQTRPNWPAPFATTARMHLAHCSRVECRSINVYANTRATSAL